MIEGSGGDALLENFVAAQRSGIGWFTADLTTGRWVWSPSLDTFFGSPATDVTPSWDQIVDHIPDEDRDVALEAFRQATSQTGPFSWSHRIRTDDGLIRSLLIIGESTTPAPSTGTGDPDQGGAAAAAVTLKGYVIDLTELRVHGAHAAADEAVQRSAAHRATIEQAKGALMLVYRLTPQAAFALLAWHSQHANRKLHLIATDLLQAFHDHDLADTHLRAAVDQLLNDAANRPETPPAEVTAPSDDDS